MIYSAIFAIIVGIGMMGQWLASFLSKSIPELKTEPIRIWFHIAAEMATALLLVVSGILLLSGVAVGQTIFLIAVGMLFYTCIVSPGYFAQQGNWNWVIMFSGLIVLGIVGIVLVV
jgi:hypothetical protein